jgi:hypothetical protein
MRSSTLIASYLWKDTWKRWFEQPSSPLARLFVTGLLVLVATVILVAFHLLERSLRERLERFGLNTVLVRETIGADSKELITSGEGPDRLEPLNESGKKLRIRQLFVRGQTEWQNTLLVFTYPPEAMALLADYLSPETPIICFSDDLPEDALVKVAISRQSLIAHIRRPEGWLRPLVTDDMLLVPRGMLSDEERIGYIDTTVFQRDPDAMPVSKIVSSVNALYVVERRTPPQIQSAMALIREWERLKERQAQWRNILAGVLGLTLSLVYGAIAILEFRQNLYVSALLRSFGAPPRYLYFRHLIENAILANVAGCVAIASLGLLHSTIFGTLGFSKVVLDLRAGNPYLSPEMLVILCWVNIGAFLSSLPVAFGLRQPVGSILN